MLRLAVRSLTMAGAMAAVVFMAPAWSAAGLFDCFGHCGTPAPVAMAPACGACAAPTVAYMPTSVYRTLYAPACANCPAAAPCGACGTCGTCNTCNSYAVTTYRPWYGGWTTYSARLMPYTTYQPVTYAPPCGVCGSCAPACGSCGSACGSCGSGGGCCLCSMFRSLFGGGSCSTCNACAAYSPCSVCSPCTSCNSCVSYSPCASCGTCASCSPCFGCSSCASCAPSVGCSACGGSCGTISYAAPAPACASCAAPVVAAPAMPAPVAAPAPMAAPVPVPMAPANVAPATPAPTPVAPVLPGLAPQGASPQVAPPPSTFEKSQKPAGEPELGPTPHPDTRLNSMPAPLLSAPHDRTAARPNYASPAIHLVASPVAPQVQDNDGWAPARN